LYLVPSHCRIPPNFPFTLCTGWERLRKVRKQERINNWELGVVAFGSTDLNKPNPTYQTQSQFALGPLIGYHFGALEVQVKLTSDVYQRNYGGYDRRIWASIIFPL
jgi:hypothetical protein